MNKYDKDWTEEQRKYFDLWHEWRSVSTDHRALCIIKSCKRFAEYQVRTTGGRDDSLKYCSRHVKRAFRDKGEIYIVSSINQEAVVSSQERVKSQWLSDHPGLDLSREYFYRYLLGISI